MAEAMQRPLPSSLVLVAIPALDEQQTIGGVVRSVVDIGHEVLVVDDGSSDRTGPIAASAGATVATLPVNLGVGGALRCAFAYAVRNGFEAVVQVDADGQHSAEQISRLIDEAVKSDADMVIGSRFRDAETTMAVQPIRRSAMRILSWQATLAARTPITDSTSGFRLVREPLLSCFSRRFPSHYLGDTHEALLSAARAGYVIREVPAAIHVRRHGDSSASNGAASRLTLRTLLAGLLRMNFTTEPRARSTTPTRQRSGSPVSGRSRTPHMT